MPTYEYLCEGCASRYEKREGFDAPARQKCPTCGKRANRVLHAPPIVFKGSGFYKTDSRGTSTATADTSDTTSAPRRQRASRPPRRRRRRRLRSSQSRPRPRRTPAPPRPPLRAELRAPSVGRVRHSAAPPDDLRYEPPVLQYHCRQTRVGQRPRCWAAPAQPVYVTTCDTNNPQFRNMAQDLWSRPVEVRRRYLSVISAVVSVPPVTVSFEPMTPHAPLPSREGAGG